MIIVFSLISFIVIGILWIVLALEKVRERDEDEYR